ncbi:unnamed protein product [Fusarium graminearum]|uniref:Chromosome 4, complete genome n=1 Tax=Gibberella zeae (strain ATCC MYA-4620 / CBS 123657 / FGSC 9075 / NRRL 31084 / PH-1) TaxID=229533 RepID=A0A098DUH8_GIBZE|nr:unnamed protein product [Fusarium graminearum]CZS72494.1 unnamed protein product [Fusarium graminearum]
MVPMRCTHPERIRSGDMLEKYRAKTSSKVKFLGVLLSTFSVKSVTRNKRSLFPYSISR